MIRPNGRTGPCCMFDYSGEYIHNNSLKNIWFGEYFTKTRENLYNGKLQGYCFKCNPSQVINNIKIKKKLDTVL